MREGLEFMWRIGANRKAGDGGIGCGRVCVVQSKRMCQTWNSGPDVKVAAYPLVLTRALARIQPLVLSPWQSFLDNWQAREEMLDVEGGADVVLITTRHKD